MTKPKIELSDGVGLGVIICFNSGVLYSNQTGGAACLHPEIEGVYVPLRNDYSIPEHILISPELELSDYFEGPKYRCEGATKGLDSEDVQFIHRVLEKANLSVIQINEAKLKESHEAWVHAILNGDESDSLPIFEGFEPYPREAILTWGNSD